MKFDYQRIHEEVLVENATTTVDNSHQLVVYNDDHNTFDWVIQCFIEILEHSLQQAEQLSLIIHYKGKAIVKTADYDTLKPSKDALIERGLSAVIQEYAR